MKLKKYLKKTFYIVTNNPLNKLILEQDLKQRENVRFTNIQKLSKKINMFSPFSSEIHKPNDWYGHANNLKIFLGIARSYKFKFIMEHGLYLNDQVDEIDRESDLPSYITYSDYRKKILEKYSKNVFSIGPFIHYAKSFLPEKELKSEKKRLGKSVLFFPAHSTSIINFNYDVEKLCKQIKKITRDFKTVRVCLYWKDVLLGRNKIYEDFGFECVTAGHMLDPLFLPRLKSLIEISDLTIANIVSSQTGFSIHLNRPHILINQKINIKTSKYWHNRINEAFESDGYHEVVSEFSKINYKITKRQRDIINRYWGSKNVKTKGELKKIVDLTEKIYQKV